jgi:hypothetical protein
MGPLRYYLVREVRLRSAALGLPVPIHEDDMVGNSTPRASSATA